MVNNYGELVAFVVAVVEWLKKRFKLNGWAAAGLGIGIGLVGSFIFGQSQGWQVWQSITAGVLAGVVSGGFFDIVKEFITFLAQLVSEIQTKRGK